MKAKYAVPIVLVTGLAGVVGNAYASDEALGAILGATTGAVVGHAIGGRDAAVAGGAFGAILGAAAASDRDDYYYGPPPVAYGPPVVYEQPRYVYGPPPVVVDYAPVRHYGYYGYPHAWGHDRAHWDRVGHGDHRRW